MIRFRVFRFDPACDKAPRFDTFEVPAEKGMPVLDGLAYIFENVDHSLAYRSSCRTALCGSCAMHINGRYRLACQTQIADVVRHGLVEVRPLAHLPVLRDLVVDMTGFMDQWRRIQPYLISTRPPSGGENPQTPEQRQLLDGLIDCILCGACYAACPTARDNPKYLGPHALMRALRFIDDSRDEATEERLAQVASEQGVFRCHTVFNCQTVCPKDLDPAGAIVRIKRHAVSRALRASGKDRPG
ncbi:MAG: succinate dehydrogenase iron-sulfur subunit [Betaproteobacteria bacterium]|nr:succinate dehydrogenase iron-sulfur subunit [Betaproteobacteria bacterium]